MSTQTKERPGLSWKEVCEDPHLQDLPYKIETNGRGQIVMSPTYAWHGRFAYQIAQQLEELLPDGVSSVETAIQTAKGTKVADAIWCTAERWAEIKDAYDVPVAPEICVEVRSPTNTDWRSTRSASSISTRERRSCGSATRRDDSRFTTTPERLTAPGAHRHFPRKLTCRRTLVLVTSRRQLTL